MLLPRAIGARNAHSGVSADPVTLRQLTFPDLL